MICRARESARHRLCGWYPPLVSDEVELLDAWRAGDRAAGQALFSRYYDAVSRFFVNKVAEAPADLVQETFMACVKGRDRIREGGSFRSYLFGVAYNVLKGHLRRRYDARGDMSMISVEDLSPGASTLMQEVEQTRLLAHALRMLPVELQVMMELRYWERMNSTEISTVLGVPAGTVRDRLRRGRGLLEDAMRRISEDPAVLGSTLGDIDGWARQIREGMRPSPS